MTEKVTEEMFLIILNFKKRNWKEQFTDVGKHQGNNKNLIIDKDNFNKQKLSWNRLPLYSNKIRSKDQEHY